MQVTLAWRLPLGTVQAIQIAMFEDAQFLVCWVIFEGSGGEFGVTTITVANSPYAHYDLRPHLFLFSEAGELTKTLCYCWGE